MSPASGDGGTACHATSCHVELPCRTLAGRFGCLAQSCCPLCCRAPVRRASPCAVLVAVLHHSLPSEQPSARQLCSSTCCRVASNTPCTPHRKNHAPALQAAAVMAAFPQFAHTHTSSRRTTPFEQLPAFLSAQPCQPSHVATEGKRACRAALATAAHRLRRSRRQGRHAAPRSLNTVATGWLASGINTDTQAQRRATVHRLPPPPPQNTHAFFHPSIHDESFSAALPSVFGLVCTIPPTLGDAPHAPQTLVISSWPSLALRPSRPQSLCRHTIPQPRASSPLPGSLSAPLHAGNATGEMQCSAVQPSPAGSRPLLRRPAHVQVHLRRATRMPRLVINEPHCTCFRRCRAVTTMHALLYLRPLCRFPTGDSCPGIRTRTRPDSSHVSPARLQHPIAQRRLCASFNTQDAERSRARFTARPCSLRPCHASSILVRVSTDASSIPRCSATYSTSTQPQSLVA